MDKKKGTLSQLLEYAGNYKGLTFIGCILSAIAMIVGMFPYICIWLVIRDLVRVAPNYTNARKILKGKLKLYTRIAMMVLIIKVEDYYILI